MVDMAAAGRSGSGAGVERLHLETTANRKEGWSG